MEISTSQAGFYHQNTLATLKAIKYLFFNTDISQIRMDNTKSYLFY